MRAHSTLQGLATSVALLAAFALSSACGNDDPTSNEPLVAPTGFAATATSASTVHLAFEPCPEPGDSLPARTEIGQFVDVESREAAFDIGLSRTPLSYDVRLTAARTPVRDQSAERTNTRPVRGADAERDDHDDPNAHRRPCVRLSGS